MIFDAVEQILLLLVKQAELLLEARIPVFDLLGLHHLLVQLFLILLVLLYELLRLLVLRLALHGVPLCFLGLEVQLVPHVRKHYVQVDSILVFSDYVWTGAALSVLIQKVGLGLLCALLTPSLLQKVKHAVALQLLLDHVLQDLNVTALLFIRESFLSESELKLAILRRHLVDMLLQGSRTAVGESESLACQTRRLIVRVEPIDEVGGAVAVAHRRLNCGG